MSAKKGNSKKATSNKKTRSNLDENLEIKKQIKKLKSQQQKENTISYQLMPSVLLFLAIFVVIIFAFPDKMGVLKYFKTFAYGIFSHGAWLLPVALFVEAFNWKQDYLNDKVTNSALFSLGFMSFFSSVLHLAYLGKPEVDVSFNIFKLYDIGVSSQGGGAIGGILGAFFYKFTGMGAWIICLFSALLLGFAMFRITPLDIVVYIKNKFRELVYSVNKARMEHIEQSIEQQKIQQSERAKELNEQSAQDEANDAKTLRKRRAFLSGADEVEADSLKTEEIPTLDEQQQIKSEITPCLSPDDSVPPWDNETSTYVDEKAYDEIKNIKSIMQETNTDKAEENIKTEFSSLFVDGASIAIAGSKAGAEAVTEGTEVKLEENLSDTLEVGTQSVTVDAKPKIEEIYNFPPINFLQKDPNPLTFAVTDELKMTSVKLVETLGNFGVKTKIMNISCGPTVTRYELQPEIGVRVRAIANLSDDIALHLAAAGVRIEAPIPGKDAVGIEIPNKTVSTVYLRNLVENPLFSQQKSNLSVCLGMDVAGSPVYMNVAKMPHMLIAGATGMGKSVCINSFIVSLLYKARPDEVKLILIDPKKVELSIYNGLPHLLVPVVSDPKKAAGSLAWAVNEMERRFQLIEEVGVRDLDSYNAITKDDPEKEYIPKIVIIIDELADLMMTARDEVESSICRIAQKARAAGMHLVIGTQRPSVDVITGLIKANVPSRIAFTVASQVDSRTIIDVSGAEKLLGRGDMLYAPVGCMKPIRVQGAFVSEREIENIVQFLKDGKTYEYDTSIIESIEREAARCGEKKRAKGGMDADFDDAEDKASILASDDAIFPAIEIAVDTGSISTSLLQRKLSLGYSRAARIVDKLEKIGVVGPFEGSKPRKVLITREEYHDMRMTYEGADE